MIGLRGRRDLRIALWKVIFALRLVPISNFPIPISLWLGQITSALVLPVALSQSLKKFHHGHRSPGRFIPHFSTVGVAFSDARNSMRRFDASGFLAPFTTAAANTWTN
jgi:hypothetical protein